MKFVFSSLYLCMQIMMKKTNYVMLLLLKDGIMFEPLMDFWF